MRKVFGRYDWEVASLGQAPYVEVVMRPRPVRWLVALGGSAAAMASLSAASVWWRRPLISVLCTVASLALFAVLFNANEGTLQGHNLGVAGLLSGPPLTVAIAVQPLAFLLLPAAAGPLVLQSVRGLRWCSGRYAPAFPGDRRR